MSEEQDSNGFQLVYSFGVDDGELDGLSPQECFVLGVEWQMVRSMAESDDIGEFRKSIHNANRERIGKMLDKIGRRWQVTFSHEDPSEEWLLLECGEKPAS